MLFALILRILSFIFISLTSAITILGNMIIILCFIKYKNLRTYSNYYILSMSVSDFIIGFFCMPFYAYSTSFNNGYWSFGLVYCHIWLFLSEISHTTCVFTILAISFDRFVCVIYPIRYRIWSIKKHVLTFLCLIWFSSLVNYVPIYIFWPHLLVHVEVGKNSTSLECHEELRNNIFTSFTFAIFEFVIPFFLITVFSISVNFNIRERMSQDKKIIRTISKKLRISNKEKSKSRESN